MTSDTNLLQTTEQMFVEFKKFEQGLDQVKQADAKTASIWTQHLLDLFGILKTAIRFIDREFLITRDMPDEHGIDETEYYSEKGVLLLNDEIYEQEYEWSDSGIITGHRYYLLRDGSVVKLSLTGTFAMGAEWYSTTQAKITLAEFAAEKHTETDVKKIISNLHAAFKRAIRDNENKLVNVQKRAELIQELADVIKKYK